MISGVDEMDKVKEQQVFTAAGCCTSVGLSENELQYLC